MKLAYNVKEAAEACGISPDTIKRAIRAGDLMPSNIRIDGRPVSVTLIKVDELNRWLDNGQRS